ncbi:MAG: thioredoxin family protein [Verrucomicrobium sp.]|nr:thioredoxin family protein [Verrucomicrobium sp.]
MKRLLLLALVWGTALCGLRAEAVWLTDYVQAINTARKEQKPLFIDFTGSDWCGWCVKFDKEVLSTPEFEAYAQDKLVLLRADFPQKHPLPVALTQQNQSLAQKYKVDGFPTLLLISPTEKVLARFDGYQEGGPQPFIERLKKDAGSPYRP